MAETNATSIAEGLLRQVLMAFVSFWYEKNKDMSITSRHVDTPVITNEQVKTWLASLANVFETELDNAVTETSTTIEYKKFLEKYTDPKSVEYVANSINNAMRKSKSYDNFINSMHGSIRAIVINNKSVKTNDKVVHIGSGHVKPGAKLWFVPSSVFVNKKRSMKTNNDNAVINALQNELCIYEMYSPQDCEGGKTGKVIQCPKSSGGFKDIAKMLAKTINDKLNSLYDCPNPTVAVPRSLSQIKYKNKFKDLRTGKEVFKDVTGINSSYTDGVDIDCSEPLRTKSGEPIDPRLAVTRLFNERQIDYVASDAEKISETVDNARTSEDTDEEASLINKHESDVAGGHNTMVDNYASSGIDEDLDSLESRCKDASGWIQKLQTAAVTYEFWPAGMYDKLKISSDADIYEKILKTAEWLSKYIISTGNPLPSKYKPFGVNVILGKDRFVLATNVMPSTDSDDSLSLHAYAQFIKNGIAEGRDEAKQKGVLRGSDESKAMTSAETALEDMVSFIEKAYKKTKVELYNANKTDDKRKNNVIGVEKSGEELKQLTAEIGKIKVPLGIFIKSVGMIPKDFEIKPFDPVLHDQMTFDKIITLLGDILEKYANEHDGYEIETSQEFNNFITLDQQIYQNGEQAVPAAKKVITALKSMASQADKTPSTTEPVKDVTPDEPKSAQTETPKESEVQTEPEQHPEKEPEPPSEEPVEDEEPAQDEEDSQPDEPYADDLDDIDNLSNDW